MYLPSCDLKKNSYARTVPSPYPLSSVALNSLIYIAWITSASKLFHVFCVSVWIAVLSGVY